MKKSLQKEVKDKYEDYGLYNNLQNINVTINKILNSNANINEENESLRNKIEKLESNINTLVSNNEKLTNLLEKLDEKQEIQIDNYKKDHNNVSIDEIEVYSETLDVVKKALSLKENDLNENLIKSILGSVSSILERESENTENNQILETVELMYKSLDEDLLIKFTNDNHLHILKMIDDNPEKSINMIIKIIRILYSMEQFIEADNYMILLDFNNLSPYLNDNITIDLLLIDIHLLDPENRQDIEYLWSNLKDNNHPECKDMQSYLIAREDLDENKTDMAKQYIEMISPRLDSINTVYPEVKYTIRLNSYTFMLRRLQKIVDMQTDEKEVGKNLNEEYFDHRLYMKEYRNDKCPFDGEKLLEKTIIEKIQNKKEGMNTQESLNYEETEVFYCFRCNEYFIQPTNSQEIEKYINLIKINNTTVPSSNKQDNEFKLNSDSPLSRRGYNVTLNDDKRWEILKKKCIPEVGISRVLYYLRRFISRASGHKTKNYSNSIRIWTSDMERIIREYR